MRSAAGLDLCMLNHVDSQAVFSRPICVKIATGIYAKMKV